MGARKKDDMGEIKIEQHKETGGKEIKRAQRY